MKIIIFLTGLLLSSSAYAANKHRVVVGVATCGDLNFTVSCNSQYIGVL